VTLEALSSLKYYSIFHETKYINLCSFYQNMRFPMASTDSYALDINFLLLSIKVFLLGRDKLILYPCTSTFQLLGMVRFFLGGGGGEGGGFFFFFLVCCVCFFFCWGGGGGRKAGEFLYFFQKKVLALPHVLIKNLLTPHF